MKKNDMGGEVKRAIVSVEEKNIKRGFIEEKMINNLQTTCSDISLLIKEGCLTKQVY